MTLEDQAIEFGVDWSRVYRRLKVAKQCLNIEGRKAFKIYHTNRTLPGLVSECGCLALIWKVREYPEAPISYHNQQTSEGTVVLVDLPLDN